MRCCGPASMCEGGVDQVREAVGFVRATAAAESGSGNEKALAGDPK